MQHTNPSEIDSALFKKKWQEGVDIIKSLGFVFDSQSLLQESLDPKNHNVLTSLNLYLDLLRRNVDDLQNDNKATQDTLDEVLNEQDDLRELVENLQKELALSKAMMSEEAEKKTGIFYIIITLNKVKNE